MIVSGGINQERLDQLIFIGQPNLNLVNSGDILTSFAKRGWFIHGEKFTIDSKVDALIL